MAQPEGFHRIRYYGFLGNRYRKEKLEQCRQLLGMAETAAIEKCDQDYRDRYEALTGSSLSACPVCKQGRMIVLGTIDPFPSPRSDTS